MKTTAKGGLRHYFHGNYSAGIALVFDSPELAAAALPALGVGWNVGDKNKAVLVWFGDSVAIAALKERFKGEGFTLAMVRCSWGHCENSCTNAEIDGIPHSIDSGPPFTLTVECADPRQVNLF